MEGIIDKVRKLLALAEDRDDDEAQAAILRAQHLIAKYNIDRNVLSSGAEEVKLYEEELELPFNWYRVELLVVLCRNFKTYSSVNQYGPRLRRLSIVGERIDVELTRNVFLYALTALEAGANRYAEQPEVKRKWKRKKGMKNQYINGFIKGLFVKLEMQKRASEDMALALTIHPAIVEQANEKFEQNNEVYVPKEIDRGSAAFVSGFVDGKQFDEKIRLESQA